MKHTIIILSVIFSFSTVSYSQTQAEMNDQAKDEYKKADEIMAVNYKKLMGLEDATGKKLLLESQRAWIKYKEAHCKYEGNEVEGGSMQPLFIYTCQKQLTEERNKILVGLIKLKEL